MDCGKRSESNEALKKKIKINKIKKRCLESRANVSTLFSRKLYRGASGFARQTTNRYPSAHPRMKADFHFPFRFFFPPIRGSGPELSIRASTEEMKYEK